jgi:hypothetical protein
MSITAAVEDSIVVVRPSGTLTHCTFIATAAVIDDGDPYNAKLCPANFLHLLAGYCTF